MISSEVFQKDLLEALCCLPFVVCIADDIVMHGGDAHEHDEGLSMFFERCLKIGIKLNKDKLDVASPKRWFGYVFAQQGS